MLSFVSSALVVCSILVLSVGRRQLSDFAPLPSPPRAAISCHLCNLRAAKVGKLSEAWQMPRDACQMKFNANEISQFKAEFLLLGEARNLHQVHWTFLSQLVLSIHVWPPAQVVPLIPKVKKLPL